MDGFSTGQLLRGLRTDMTPDETASQLRANWKNHAARREQDEMVCPRCGKRWDAKEEPPLCR